MVRIRRSRRRGAAVLAMLIVALLPAAAPAHGSVTPDADLCIIRIGFLRAHFKIYQPETRGHRQYCEDLPDAGDSVFVMEYEHDALGEVPIDFRIVENTTGRGRFTNQALIEAIDDLDSITVFHHPSAVQRDVFTVAHEFRDTGEFVGIVTVPRLDGDGYYRAVFPFEVGYTGLGPWPWLVAAVVLLQLNWFWMSGRFRPGRKDRSGSIQSIPGRAPTRRGAALPAAALAALLGCAALPADAADTSVRSDDGRFVLRYESEIDPIVINRMHDWVLHVVDDAGVPVEGATIRVDGGMPAHDHGLPTEPRVTREIGGGDYLLQGLRFHMNGEWQIDIAIDADGVSDTVTITLQL